MGSFSSPCSSQRSHCIDQPATYIYYHRGRIGYGQLYDAVRVQVVYQLMTAGPGSYLSFDWWIKLSADRGCSSLDRRVKLPTYWSGSCASFGSGLWRLIQQFSHICVTRKMSGQCAIRSSWRYSRTPRVSLIIRCILRTGSTSRGLCGTKTPTRTINSDGHTSYFIYCAYQ